MELNEHSVVAITGAGSGIGAAMALAFARQQCTVLAIDIDEKAAAQTADAITGIGGKSHSYTADVSNSEDVEALAKKIFDRFGHVDVLCANAGVSMRPLRASWEASLEDYRWMNDINYFGFVHCIRSFVPRMLPQQGRRQILLTSSVLALGHLPGNGPYAATKGAVTSLADSLRSELAEVDPDFQVSALYPGTVHTAIHQSERLRPETERSSSREIVEYKSKEDPPYFFRVPMDAATVADLVITGIHQDKQAVLTYPYAASGFDARANVIRSGDPITFFRS